MNTIRVRGVTWASSASTSAFRFFSGAATGVAPQALAEIGYIRKPWALYNTSSPGPT